MFDWGSPYASAVSVERDPNHPVRAVPRKAKAVFFSLSAREDLHPIQSAVPVSTDATVLPMEIPGSP